MILLRRIRFLVGCVAATAAVLLALHLALQPATPGQSITWSQPAGAAAAATPNAYASLPAASPTPRPGGAGMPPLGAVMQHLNAETARSASGQYSILQSLEDALREHIDQFLDWIVSRH